MKKIILFFIILSPLAGFCQNGLLKKFKQKVEARVEQRADEGVNNAVDTTEENGKKGSTAPKQKDEKKEEKTNVATATPAAPSTSFESYSHYDFIPGDNILFAEDFSQDVVGEFPLKWATDNRGETVIVQGMENKWLRLYQKGIFLSPYIKNLPDNFTAEFDLVLNYTAEDLNYLFPQITIGFLAATPGDEKGNKYFSGQAATGETKFVIAPENEAPSTIHLESTKGGTETFSNQPKPLEKLNIQFGKPVHFAVWVQKERFRLWMNGEKVYDVPRAVPENTTFNRMVVQVASSNYDDEKVGYYLSNIKVAQGLPDMRSKLLTEGKLTTTGILFDVNSDQIKPESFGVLQAIANVLKENTSVNIKIIGHTDSDGDDAKNLDLSKRRATSVKQALSAQFGIVENRMQTDGKGESQPISDNNTKEGKAKNRRVEFLKL